MLFLEKTHAEWAALSGLTPATAYSLADHAMAALVAEHSVTGSLADLISLGIPTGAEPDPEPLAHVATALGTSHFSSDPAPSTHTVTKPAGATEGRLLIVELSARMTGTGVLPGSTFASIPAGWDTVLTGADNGTEDTVRLGIFSRLMTASEPATWDWTTEFPANSVDITRIFSGDGLTTPQASVAQQASSVTTRPTPTIVTEAAGIVCYSTSDRNSSLPAAPEESTKVTFDQVGSTLMLSTARVDPAVAGSYQRTFTGAVATGLAVNAIYSVVGS